MPSSDGSGLITVPSGAGVGLDGAFTELIAATTFASTWMLLQVNLPSGNVEAQLDIATGLAASEVEVLSDQYYRALNVGGGWAMGSIYSFPMTIPSGTRLSARIKDDSGSANNYLFTLSTSDQVPVSAIPSSSQSSGAKVVTSGGLNAYGSWVELIASLDIARVWLMLTAYDFNTSNPRAEFDVGIGSAGNEVSIMDTVGLFKVSGGSGIANSLGYYFPMSLPAGTRIAIRIKDDSASLLNYTVGAVAL